MELKYTLHPYSNRPLPSEPGYHVTAELLPLALHLQLTQNQQSHILQQINPYHTAVLQCGQKTTVFISYNS